MRMDPRPSGAGVAAVPASVAPDMPLEALSGVPEHQDSPNAVIIG